MNKYEEMDDCPELVLKTLCCTCLIQNRKLLQLCRLPEGINNLYLLLSYDSEAYREGFYKDTGHWHICWECWAVMRRISRFRSQACAAQRLLAELLDGRTDLKLFNTHLSRLSSSLKTSYDQTIVEPEISDTTDNFIDCGDIKAESDDDVPLSELHTNIADDRQYTDDNRTPHDDDQSESLVIQPIFKKRKKINTKKKDRSSNRNRPKVHSEKGYTRMQISEEEMREYRERRKMAVVYSNAKFKCESCVEVFKSEIALNEHALEFHTEKEDHHKCDICLMYIHQSMLPEHLVTHYSVYQCSACSAVACSAAEMQHHVAMQHGNAGSKGSRKVRNPGSEPRRGRAMMDERTPHGYKCAECEKYFDNKNLRWKHVQRAHREGYKCSTCDKRFAFKNNLARHELGHVGPAPRSACPQCRKSVRVDLLRAHLRIHSARERFACAECDKRFASKASYEHHLKYTQRHANATPNKYKCSLCDKGYRSRGEMRDHVNYAHMGKTRHKCPVCGKGLATPRCVTRHVRRAHEGRKEQARDKVCQLCGKAFRDKKTLREHEYIHTGERPLSCEICGCTFRQSASLYTHRKRVHRIYPQQRRVQLVDAGDQEP